MMIYSNKKNIKEAATKYADLPKEMVRVRKALEIQTKSSKTKMQRTNVWPKEFVLSGSINAVSTTCKGLTENKICWKQMEAKLQWYLKIINK